MKECPSCKWDRDYIDALGIAPTKARDDADDAIVVPSAHPECQTGRGCSPFALSSTLMRHSAQRNNGRASPAKTDIRSLDPPRALRRIIPD